VLLSGEPQKLIDAIDGKIWERFVAKHELATFQQKHAVISTRLLTGRTLIHVVADADPGDGFEPAKGDLEDVYFATIAGRNAAAAALR